MTDVMTHQKKLLVLPLRCSSGYRGSLASYFPVGPTLNDNSLFFHIQALVILLFNILLHNPLLKPIELLSFNFQSISRSIKHTDVSV